MAGENFLSIDLTLDKDQYIGVVGTGANSVFYSVEGIIPSSLTVGSEYSGGDGTKKIQFKLTGSVVF